jgi:hypothetical protein
MHVETVRSLYASMPERLDRARRIFGRPLTLTDKILIAHAVDLDRQVFDPVHGALTGPDGTAFRFTPPEGEELPHEGFARGADRISIVGLAALEPGKPVTVEIKKPDGRVEKIEALHTMTREQIAWFRAGSALNAGSPIDLATSGPASFADAKLAPGDTQAKPGKDNR